MTFYQREYMKKQFKLATAAIFLFGLKPHAVVFRRLSNLLKAGIFDVIALEIVLFL
jgi:hypothetical protein